MGYQCDGDLKGENNYNMGYQRGNGQGFDMGYQGK